MPEKIYKMPEFYTIFARKNTFCPNLGGATAPCPPSPTPVIPTGIWILKEDGKSHLLPQDTFKQIQFIFLYLTQHFYV